jgi:hypothetical protein
MSVTAKVVKTELTEVCLAAISKFLSSTRGANMFGANARVIQPKPNHLQVHAADGRFFEVVVKEAW